MVPTKEGFNLLMATMCLTPVLHPFRLYVLWGFVVVTTSVTKVAKRKVSHQLIIKLEFMRNRVAVAGSELKKSNQNGIKNCTYV